MPTTIYDSSLITQRHRATTISKSFVSRISPWNAVPQGQSHTQPTTGYAPRLGIYDQSIINTINNGQMAEYRKGEGSTTINYGCPCNGLGVVCSSNSGSTVLPPELLWRILPPNDLASTEVYAMAFDTANGVLYLGGTFTTINSGTTSVNRIVKWDGNTLSPVSDGINNGVDGDVYALAVSNGILYVGGFFTQLSGGTVANSIAQYNINTNQWQTLGNQDGNAFGFNESVNCLAVDETGNIYIAGVFTRNANLTQTYNNIVKYNPNISPPTLSKLLQNGTGANGTNGQISTITIVPNGYVFVGGTFTTAGGISVSNITFWNPVNSTWNATGSGLNGTISSLTLNNNILYICGSFTEPVGTGITTKNIAQLNINSFVWSPVGTGTEFNDGYISVIFVFQNKLYVGGNFTTAGGSPANGLAQWDGSNWSSVNGSLTSIDAGQSEGIYSLCSGIINGYTYIYAGGKFGPLEQGAGNGIGNPVVGANHVAYYGPL
jgi:hypothetical protein